MVLPLERGTWTLTRISRRVACDACMGTEAMATTTNTFEVFLCGAELAPGALVAACLHEVVPAKAKGGAAAAAGRRVWVFCPDPLCMSSRPVGSALPAWPWDLPLASGLRLSGPEAAALAGFELGVL